MSKTKTTIAPSEGAARSRRRPAAASNAGGEDDDDVDGKGAGGAGAPSGAPPAPLPLAQRPVDRLLVAWYCVFLFTVLWTDLHNFSASLRTAVQWGARSWAVSDLEQLVMRDGGSLVFPPRWLSYYYFRWARTADPLLYQNPIWWQCIEWVNLLCLMPFAALAIPAFARGDNRVALPAVVVSSFTFYSLILCIGASLFGDEPGKVSPQKGIFFFIYVPYLLFPAVVVARLAWAGIDAPFSRALPPAAERALIASASAIFASFAAAGVVWYLRCEAGTDAQNLAACPLVGLA